MQQLMDKETWLILSKKQPKFFADPTQDPSFEEIQAKWYDRLRREGFEDQENEAYADRPLKRWSGISSIYVDTFQPAGSKIISSFPESLLKEEEHFQNHPEFKELCISLCVHGNSRLSPKRVQLIWMDYCSGKTQRESELKHKVSDTTVLRIIRRITEWMGLMGTRLNNSESDDTATIVIRQFVPRDTPIVYATWRNAIWYDQKRDERLAHEFYAAATRSIKDLLAKPSTEVRIACDKKDPDFIAGYSVLTGSFLHFAYVKIDYRKKGIARLLCKGVKSVAQPATKIGKEIVEDLRLEVKENHGPIQ